MNYFSIQYFKAITIDNVKQDSKELIYNEKMRINHGVCTASYKYMYSYNSVLILDNKIKHIHDNVKCKDCIYSLS